MSSSIRFHVDLADFGRQIQLLANATKKTLSDVVKDQSRLLVRDLIRSTPPHGTRPIKEDWTFQRHKGEKTIETDVRRLFSPISNIKAVMYPTSASHHSRNIRRQYLQQMAVHGDWKGLSQALFFMKVTPDLVEMTGTIGVSDYRTKWAKWQKRGRIPKNTRDNTMVWESSAVNKVVHEIQLRVGWAKAGWLRAAAKLGVKRLPTWVTRHSGAPGSFEDLTTDTDMPSFTMTNDVPYIGYLNNGGRLVSRAMANRQRAMEISTEKAIEHFWRDFEKAA